MISRNDYYSHATTLAPDVTYSAAAAKDVLVALLEVVVDELGALPIVARSGGEVTALGGAAAAGERHLSTLRRQTQRGGELGRGRRGERFGARYGYNRLGANLVLGVEEEGVRGDREARRGALPHEEHHPAAPVAVAAAVEAGVLHDLDGRGRETARVRQRLEQLLEEGYFVRARRGEAKGRRK